MEGTMKEFFLTPFTLLSICIILFAIWLGVKMFVSARRQGKRLWVSTYTNQFADAVTAKLEAKADQYDALTPERKRVAVAGTKVAAVASVPLFAWLASFINPLAAFVIAIRSFQLAKRVHGVADAEQERLKQSDAK